MVTGIRFTRSIGDRSSSTNQSCDDCYPVYRFDAYQRVTG